MGSSLRDPGGGWARARRLGAFVAAALAIQAPAAQAEESTLFSDLTTPELLELSADLGEELRGRGVMPEYVDPSQDYARLLAAGALELTPSASAFADREGRRYRIEGVRRFSSSDPIRTGPLGDLAAPNFDILVVVVFRRDFQIDRAAMVPVAVVQARAVAPDATAEPTLAIDDTLWSEADVIDVTAPMNLAASRN